MTTSRRLSIMNRPLTKDTERASSGVCGSTYTDSIAANDSTMRHRPICSSIRSMLVTAVLPCGAGVRALPGSRCHAPAAGASHVDVFDLRRALHDQLEARFHLFPHQRLNG